MEVTDGRLAPYAEALFRLAKAEDALSSYQKEIKEIAELFASNTKFAKVLSAYSLPYEKKVAILESLLKDSKCVALLTFMKLITRRHVIGSFASIAHLFENLVNADLGVKEGIAYSVYPLSEKEIKKLEQALKKKTGEDVVLTNRIDTGLIGGVKVALNGRLYDGSIEGKIERLRHILLKGDESL